VIHISLVVSVSLHEEIESWSQNKSFSRAIANFLIHLKVLNLFFFPSFYSKLKLDCIRKCSLHWWDCGMSRKRVNEDVTIIPTHFSISRVNNIQVLLEKIFNSFLQHWKTSTHCAIFYIAFHLRSKEKHLYLTLKDCNYSLEKGW
jgi:hypothetical protein